MLNMQEVTHVSDKTEGQAKIKRSEEKVVIGATVKPKLSKYGPSFRPYYVASEITQRDRLLIGVLASEFNLETLGTAINNTWLPDLPRVILYVPYSKHPDFHEKYNKVLGLPVVQLADAEEDKASKTRISFKMLHHLQKNYNDKYDWFMRVEEATYLQPGRLIDLVNMINSSMNIYVGLPASYSATSDYKPSDLSSGDRYCQGKAGVLLSRVTLNTIVPHLDNCLENTITDEEDIELGRCLHNHLNLQCTWNYEMEQLFVHVPKHLENPSASVVRKWLMDPSMGKEVSVFPISSAKLMYYIHQYFIEVELNQTFQETKDIQEKVKSLLPLLPDGVIEKRPTWPIAYPHPYVPKTRFGVIGWQYFTKTHIYGFSDDNPEVILEDEYKEDIDEVYDTSVKMLQEEMGSKYKVFRLINGYRKFDMLRGTDYLLDIGLRTSESSKEEVRKRVQLLRPLTILESVHMPHPTEQRGVYLVLPVKKDDGPRLERFLKMYQTNCLLTGENVLLLTVFVNIRDPSAPTQDKPFSKTKDILKRFKEKYKWAQVPWIQVGAKQYSNRLLLDIVTMKLPVSALIFLASLDIDFTVNFLGRCRQNAVDGDQVFFPIPFAMFNPDIVYRGKPKPEKFEVNKDTGIWDTQAYDLMCFRNQDYKELRVHHDSFLQESSPEDKDVLKVFQASPLRVFRATEPELRRIFEKKKCKDIKDSVEHEKCMDFLRKRMGTRSQLSAILLEKEPQIH